MPAPAAGRAASLPYSAGGRARAKEVGVGGEEPSGRIFISYRRTDAPHIAGRLFDRLHARFGAGNVFMDVDSIEPGLDFGEVIAKAVGSCDVLLAVIGDHWFDAVDEHGRRRLDDPDDMVVLEIATALERGIRVVPVLVGRAPPPRRSDLPDVLAPLARRQGVRLDHVTFGNDVMALITALDRALPVPRSGTGPPAADGGGRRPLDPVRGDWTVEDFTLLLHDRRASVPRIVAVLDVLAGRPDTEFSVTDLAAATELSRGQLQGAFAGLSHLCKALRPGVRYQWPIEWTYGRSANPGQNEETSYYLPSGAAAAWKQARAG